MKNHIKKLNKLAVIFPGIGYHCDKPLLYYSKRLAREHGYEVLEINYDLQIKARDIMHDDAAKKEAFFQALDAVEKVLSVIMFSEYKDVLFVGKSIGTAIAAYYDKEHGIKARHIVFTPIPETFEYLRNDAGIVFHGTGDPWCDTAIAEKECAEHNLPLIKVYGANHSLETKDAMADYEKMSEIFKKVNEVMSTMDYKFWGWKNADVSPIVDDYKGINDPRDLYDALSEIWCAETCAPRMREDWSEDNKTLGQCSITAFLVQDIFGGKVYGIERSGGNYHCYNVIGDCSFDLTSEQFGDEVLDYTNNPEQFREVHFAKEEKRQRYELLKQKLQARMSDECGCNR